MAMGLAVYLAVEARGIAGVAGLSAPETYWLAACGVIGVGCGLVVLLARLAARVGPRVADALSGVSLGTLAFAVVLDTRLYGLVGHHLTDADLWQTMSNPGVEREVHLGAATWTSMGGLLALLIAVPLAGLRLLRRRAAPLLPRLGRWATGVLMTLSVGGLMGAVLFGGERLTEALPLGAGRVGGELPAVSATSITYPPAVPETARLKDRPDVLFVLVESLRADTETTGLLPRLGEFARRHPPLRSDRHFSGGHSTEFGTFTALYSLWSYHFVPFSKRPVAEAPRAFPLEVLRKNGYRTVGASASMLEGWNDADFIVTQLDSYAEHLEEHDGAGDTAAAAAIQEALDVREQPTFAFLFLNATHHNYHYPPEFARHEPVLPEGYDHFMGDDKLLAYRDQITNRYKNAALFVDATIARLLTRYEARIASGELIVVVTGDHGEEFWDHGLLGHSAPRFFNERLRVPLLAWLPGQHGKAVALSTHPDLWPTVFDALGLDLGTVDWTNGESLLRPRIGPVFIGSTTYPFKSARACLVDHQTKWWLERCAGSPWCLRATRTTDHADEDLTITPELRARLDGHLSAFRARSERFLSVTVE